MDYKHLYENECKKNKALLKIITHDVANPLSVINSYLELIKAGRIPSEQLPEILEKIRLNNVAAMEIVRSTRKEHNPSDS